MPIERDDIVGVLLAGGQSRRMGGGDKSLRMLAGQPILQHVIDRVRGQVGTIVLNANGDPARFAAFGLPVAADVVSGYQGPLAGVLTGMMWAKEHVPEAEWILTLATDAPFVPENIATRLAAAIEDEGTDLACAASGGRNHPVIGLWPVRLAENLRSAVLDREVRKVDRWTDGFKLSVVHFANEPTDPFFNINHPDDIQKAESAFKLMVG